MNELKIIKNNDIRAIAISACPNINDTTCFEMTIGDALQEICSDKYCQVILQIRSTEDHQKRSNLKAKLKGYIFGGTFSFRRKDALNARSGVCILDFDDLDDAEEAKHILFTDPYIYASWVSPSGNGVKALVVFNYLTEIQEAHRANYHTSAYMQFKNHLDENFPYSIDTNGKDICRFCYTSYDPKLLEKDLVTAFPVSYDLTQLKSKTVLQKHKSMDTSSELEESRVCGIQRSCTPELRRKMKSLIKYLTKSKQSITKSRQEWFSVGLAIASTFSYSIGKEYFLKLCRIDGTNHNEIKSAKKLIECYIMSVINEAHTDQQITIGTVFYYAQQKGWNWGGERSIVEKDINIDA
nr:BT4734/BF3469 family protein [uncultured Sphaerochaeta sp.]